MLNYLELSFKQPTVQKPPKRDEPFFQIALPLMHTHLAHIAYLMMKTPARKHGNPDVGPNAAPTFQYDEGATLRKIVNKLNGLNLINLPEPREHMVAYAGTPQGTPVDFDSSQVAAHEPTLPRTDGRAISKLARDFEELARRAKDADITDTEI